MVRNHSWDNALVVLLSTKIQSKSCYPYVTRRHNFLLRQHIRNARSASLLGIGHK